MLSISSKLHVEYKTRIPYSSARVFSYVGVTNCHIKKGVPNCRIKKMVEHTDNQKRSGMSRLKPLSTRQANVSQISTLTV